MFSVEFLLASAGFFCFIEKNYTLNNHFRIKKLPLYKFYSLFPIFAMFKAYFDFSRNERWGLLVLVAIALTLFTWPWLYPYFAPQKLEISPKWAEEAQAFNAQLALVEQEEDKYKTFSNSYKNNYSSYQRRDDDNPNDAKTDNVVVELFVFNPNTATKEEFIKLGLSEKVAYSILNYREKGGQFRIKSDFSKIYTLQPADFERLLPYIDLPETKNLTAQADTAKKFYNNNPNANNFNSINPNPSEKYPQKAKNNSVILDINKAQAADFEQLSGVGAGYSNRIIKYRESLGGFVKIEQIGEVYGLPDSVFQKIKANLSCPNPQPKLINVNTATAEELKHPYLSFGQAKAIVRYRERQGGRVKNLDYLQTIMELDDQKKTAVRIRPYLKLD